jgi:membrane protein implicated in regulation of membrane protease activity
MSPEPRGVLSVVSDAFSQAADLVQLEFRLARAELGEKALELKAGLALIVAGAILLTATLFLLLQAAVVVLVQAGVSPALATLIVAAVCALVGFILIASGRKHLEPVALAPQRTLNELTRDSALVKEKLT